MWWGGPKKRSPEQIVLAFAEFLGRSDVLIADDRLLPMRRSDLLAACMEHLAFLENRISLFHEPKIEKQREQVMLLTTHAFNFQRIDSEDLLTVQEINNSSAYEFCRQSPEVIAELVKTDAARKALHRRYVELFVKYLKRGNAELDAWIKGP